MLSAVRHLSLATSVEVYVVALQKKHTKKCDCGCSRHDLPFRLLKTLQASLTNQTCLNFSHILIQSFVLFPAMGVEKPADSVQGKGRCGYCGQNYTTCWKFRKMWFEV